jgi:ionotropic glutamate receptor
VSSWLCSFLLVSHDSTRLGLLAQGQRPPGAGGTAAQVGVLLDLRSAGGRASRASISLALDDFYLSQPGSPRISLHVVDCKDDEITAASAGTGHLKLFFFSAYPYNSSVPKISVAFASSQITLIKYILKILIFMIHNWYNWKDI